MARVESYKGINLFMWLWLATNIALQISTATATSTERGMGTDRAFISYPVKIVTPTLNQITLRVTVEPTDIKLNHVNFAVWQLKGPGKARASRSSGQRVGVRIARTHPESAGRAQAREDTLLLPAMRRRVGSILMSLETDLTSQTTFIL